MIPDIPKTEKPAWNPETLRAIHRAQADIEKAIASVRVLSEFFQSPTYTDGMGQKVQMAPQWEWRAEEIQKQLSVLWALEDGLMGMPGIAGYGGWLWPRGNSRPYTTEEHLAMGAARRMVEEVIL